MSTAASSEGAGGLRVIPLPPERRIRGPARFAIARAQGEVLVHEGKAEEALAVMAPPLEAATKAGYAGDALELRLARVAALCTARAAPVRKQAKPERDAVEKEAARLGVGLVVRRPKAIAPR